MIRTIVADDEEIIRRGIAKIIGKDDDFDIIALAEDGEMALEYAKIHKPDLVLIDINMPFLNGLDCVEQLRTECPETVVIVITGYDDFDYAQRAIRLGVLDYLLKPVTDKGLKTVLSKAKAEISSRRHSKDYFSWSKEQLERNHKHLVSEMIFNWLDGVLTFQETQKQAEYLGVLLPKNPLVTIIHLQPTETQVIDGWDSTLIFYAAENIATELFAPLNPVISAKAKNHDLILVSEYEPTIFIKIIKEVEQALIMHLPVDVLYKQQHINDKQNISQAFLKLSEELLFEEKQNPILADARRYIESNFGDKDISLQSVADNLHISSQHLGRLFREDGNGSFNEILISIRMRNALKLLENPKYKMYEIAELTGFSTQHYFSTVFKKILGVSPAEFRKKK